jgi:3-oxoacyl-[acyl-carrier protein] reductase
MELGIKDKAALIFGGSKGLGLGCAEALAAEGVRLALFARTAATLAQSSQYLRQQYGVRVLEFACDSADPVALEQAVREAEAELGGCDILLNNTGGPPPSMAAEVTLEHWQKQFEAMVLSVLRATQIVLPGMRTRGWGRVITIASTAVVEPNPQLAISSALRATLSGYAKSLAYQVAAEGVTVNMLLPGQIDTDRTVFLDEVAASRSGKTPAQIRAEKIAGIPAKRYGLTSEFGAVAAFLASQQAAYITGSMIRVDGGVLRSV